MMEEDKNKEISEIEDNDEVNEFDEDSQEETQEDEEKSQEDKKLEDLKLQLAQLSQTVNNSKFARVDSKPEFASEIINIKNNQKICNLEETQIHELQEKRRFINLLVNFGWDRLAERLLMNVRDVENYSLSEEGMLIRNVMTEQAKTAQYTYEQNKKNKGGNKKWQK